MNPLPQLLDTMARDTRTRTGRKIVARQSQSGFNLLEVMIALLVLAIGLLGLAALQNFSLKATQQSYQSTQATVLIQDIIDRMRANTSALATYAVPFPTASIAGPDCAVAFCAPASLALHDLREWTTAMASTSGLGPSGRVQITEAPSFGGGGVMVTVALTWVETQGQIEKTAGPFVPETRRQTMTVHLQPPLP